MPAERSKTKTPDSVPVPGDPERKRVLNVLAQRRYRQRRKEKIAALEAQAKGLTPPESLDQSQHETADFDLDNGSRISSEHFVQNSGTVEEIDRVSEDIGFPMIDFDQETMDLQLFQDFDLSILPSPLPSTPSSPQALQTASRSASHSSSPPTTFPLTPDGALLGIPHLAALRAFSSIATALNVIPYIWDPTYVHTLSPNHHTLLSLPPNLHPTPAQLAIPHHPLLDMLPWPSVREKLICMFSLPSALRPPIAREEGDGHGKAVVALLQDLDDYKDGVRVHGLGTRWEDGNELVEEAWEVGESFFRNWWWCIDGRVVEMANVRRRERGEGVLRIK